MSNPTLPLPPGSTGWPLLGEAAALASDPFAWASDRVARYGPVCRSRLLTQDLAILAGPDTVGAFLDEQNVRRQGGLPPHAADLFGGGVVNQVDGDAHRRRKRHLMGALGPEALAGYLPDLRARIHARATRWAAAGEVAFQQECVRLAMDLVLVGLAGLQADDEALDRHAQGYQAFGKALLGLPLALPGSPLARARAHTKEMRAAYAALARQRREVPSVDAISWLVRSEVDGERLTDEEVAREAHHLVFAASGLWAWFCLGLKVLAEDPTLARGLREAVAALPAEPDGRQLLSCEPLLHFTRELKRVGLIVPFTAIGVARRDFEVAGHRVPEGWLVLWATHASHTVPGVAPYQAPERFDPARYARGEGAGAHHFAPQGPGEALTSHRCGGVEYSTLVLAQFFLELLRGPAFHLPPQDLSMDRARLPASWKSGLQVRFG